MEESLDTLGCELQHPQLSVPLPEHIPQTTLPEYENSLSKDPEAGRPPFLPLPPGCIFPSLLMPGMALFPRAGSLPLLAPSQAPVLHPPVF